MADGEGWEGWITGRYQNRDELELENENRARANVLACHAILLRQGRLNGSGG